MHLFVSDARAICMTKIDSWDLACMNTCQSYTIVTKLHLGFFYEL